MKELSPEELLEGRTEPRRLCPDPERLSEVSARHGLELVGPDAIVRGYGYLSSLASVGAGLVTFLSDPAYASALVGVEGVAVVTSKRLADAIPRGNSVLLTDDDPRGAFYSVLTAIAREGRTEALRRHVSPTARIHPTAVIGDHVWIEDGVVLGAHVVIEPNTYLGRNVRLKASTTIGGDGFEVATIRGRPFVVGHAGGVWLSDGVELGSGNCVDKGAFGEFSSLGQDTKSDNLVHFAHGVRIGARCMLTACVELSGSVVLGEGVWIGPGSSVSNGITIGRGALVGTGSVVVRDLPDHALAYGNPARAHGHACVCRTKLEFEGSEARCRRCGSRYSSEREASVPVGSWAAGPVFTLTSDQDWAPEWAIERLLALTCAAKVPLHVFRTSASRLLDEAFARGEITQGWHPNFQSGSTHGATPAEVIAHCRTLFGAARTVRSHGFFETSRVWLALARAGIVADSQLATRCQAELVPLDHWTGIARLPVYLEDDWYFFQYPQELPLDRVLPTLFAPGLKVLNFHPIHVACNTPSEAHYEEHRARLGSPAPPGAVHAGRGTRVLLEEIVSRVATEGHAFVSFEALVDEVLASRAAQVSK